jgi:transporter family protein
MSWFYLALASAVLWGVMALLQKNASQGEHAIQFTVTSSLIAAILALFVFPFVHLPTSPFVWLLLVFSGIVGGLGWYAGAKGFKHLSVSEASPLYNIGTVVAILFAMIFLGEKMTTTQLSGVVLVILGTYVLELKGNDLLSPFKKVFGSKKIHFVLLATLLSSALMVFSKYVLNFVEPTTYMFTQLVISAIFLLAYVFIRHDGFSDIKKGFFVHKTVVILMAALIVVGALFDFYALKLGEVSLYVPVMRTWTLIAVIFGGTFYKEGHIRNRIIATIIMLLGVFIIYL